MCESPGGRGWSGLELTDTLLNDDRKLEKFWHSFEKKFKIMLKPFFPSLPDSDSWITSMKMTDRDRQRHEKGEGFAANIY